MRFSWASRQADDESEANYIYLSTQEMKLEIAA
jgi:hypothetical protein